ncbi:HlyC/CorC family transporter [Marinilabiliaceae bacterium JC017]|nr:HlyC/CorC family transporter [Marinilabiliaceae bacterium JC017]
MDEITIILLALLFSAFFSGCEMAFVSSNKLLIELNKKKHPFLSRIIDRFLKNPSMFISTILVGNNIALVVYGLQMGKLIEPEIKAYISSDTTVLLLQTIFSTLIILLTAEFLPKTLFRINPTLVLNIFSIPLSVFYALFFPVSKLTIATSNFFLKKILGVNLPKKQNNLMLGRVDLDNLLTEHTEKAEEPEDVLQEVKLLKNALDFSKIKIRECTVPRTELEAIDTEESLSTLQQKFIETGFSKIMIYKGSIDNIIGYIHASELFKHPKSLKNIISPISIVPETMTANKLLEQFTKEHKSIALVVDEFGGTSGIITLEDILEEIFGEIDDEHDISEHVEKQISANEYHFSGRLEIDYLNEKYNLSLPESENYETLAGMILFFNQSIPKTNEELVIESFTLKIIAATESKIDLVKITIPSIA